MSRTRVATELVDTAATYGKELSPQQLRMMAKDLEGFNPGHVSAALGRCRLELRSFPSVAEIIQRLPDGRPGPEEAWNMIPKDEAESVVWSEEMRVAYSACRELISNGDLIAARMAFLERYRQEVLSARQTGAPPKWEPSFGFDKSGRVAALVLAVENGRIETDTARELLPDLSPPSIVQSLDLVARS